MSLEEKANKLSTCPNYSSPFNPKALIFCEPVGRSPGFPFANAFPPGPIAMETGSGLRVQQTFETKFKCGLQLRGQLPFLTGFPFNRLKG